MLHDEENRPQDILLACASVLVWLLWQAIRWPVLAMLIVLEPLIRIALGGFALVGTLTALMIRFAVDRPRFPFWGTLCVSLGCVGLLMLYYAAIRLLAKR
jgi:hypothetical protein